MCTLNRQLVVVLTKEKMTQSASKYIFINLTLHCTFRKVKILSLHFGKKFKQNSGKTNYPQLPPIPQSCNNSKKTLTQ